MTSASVRAFVFARVNRLPRIYGIGPAFVDDALGIGDDDVVAFGTETDEQVEAGERGCTGTCRRDLGTGDRFAGQFEPIQDSGSDNDGSPVLIVVEDGNGHPLAQLAFDLETLRRFDIFEVNAAEGRFQGGDDVDETVDVGFGHLDVEDIDAGEFLEQDGLAFHHRLCGQRADIAEAQHRSAIADDGDEILPDGEFAGLAGVGRNRE